MMLPDSPLAALRHTRKGVRRRGREQERARIEGAATLSHVLARLDDPAGAETLTPCDGCPGASSIPHEVRRFGTGLKLLCYFDEMP
jgi:hypothetical protein